jgi:CRISPR system Cascade subunit CasD
MAMHRFIVFRLYGPLAAWGDIAVGEQRPSTPHPSKSAVLGLVAAGLGIQRSDDQAHAALQQGYGFAVRVDSAGVPLRDYHTSQYAKSTARLHHLRTRRDELADRGNRATVLSTRDYRADALYTVCLHQRKEGNAPPAEAIAAALAKPGFIPYLGRRSCPTALPLSPSVIEARDFSAALAAYDTAEQEGERQEFLKRLSPKGPARERGYYWEDGVPSALGALHTTPRYDQPMSRARRQFAPRTEHFAHQGGD